MPENHTGISNRMPPEDEARDRREHPPKQGPDDRVGRVDTDPSHAGPEGERQTSHKAGSHSLAEKDGSTRHTSWGPDRRKMRPTSTSLRSTPRMAPDSAR